MSPTTGLGTYAFGVPAYGFGAPATGTTPPGGGATPGGPSSFPKLIVEIAFTTNPLSAAPMWVDVSPYLRSGSTRRGRSSELDRFSAGTMTLLLDNRDRSFDPLNTAGPHYGYLLPNRRIRVRALSLFATYPIFDGYVDTWEQAYEFKGDQRCVVTATDAFKLFAGIRLPKGFDVDGKTLLPGAFTRPVESSGARLNAILSQAKVAWPAAARTIATGSAVLAAKTYDGDGVLDALQEVAATEQAPMFVGRDGSFVFVDRNQMVTAAQFTTAQATFSDTITGANIPYSSVSFDHSDRLVRNDIVVTNPNSGAFTATAGTTPTQSFSVTVIDATPEASQSTAENLLALYKDPQSRVGAVKVVPKRTTAGWPDGLFPAILPLELGQRITFQRQPMGGGPQISQDYWIDEIGHTFGPGQWETGFRFGLAWSSQNYWIWGTGVWGTQRWAW